MNSGATTDADDLEDEAPRPPTRRDGRIIAMPAEPIPSEAFPEDLAFERTLSMACGLAIGFSGFTEPLAEARRAVWWRNDQSDAPRALAASPWQSDAAAFNSQPKENA
jgi:hypothetical protein